ncbi:unnamed protein product [Eruca vesicaria subsp. sativa]|uniref:Uncharacterized protein n=1 Tax=Eruca vesicaria subsp. sativa TaxID=29727 RepID=A0ABC8JF13_ERUVS|nr:unnamed protein product [Eruca vesicaria subsp. sativa]
MQFRTLLLKLLGSNHVGDCVLTLAASLLTKLTLVKSCLRFSNILKKAPKFVKKNLSVDSYSFSANPIPNTVADKKLYVPWVEDKKSNMRMLHISHMDDLIANSMNILEPALVDSLSVQELVFGDEAHITWFIGSWTMHVGFC